MNHRLRIVHVFRAPAGGLFRHVRDLVRGQAEAGHEVGVICDAKTGGAHAEAALASDKNLCALGIHRIAIDRMPGFGDISAANAVARICAPLKPDIIHGHGAKGGVYSRIAGRKLSIPSVYTPHGGSLHYEWSSPKGALFLAAEKMLLKRGSGLIFVCDFERDLFARKIGLGGIPHRVVHNGLWPEEFSAAEAASDATDLLFIGELRELKGIGDLIDAIAKLSSWRPLTATIVGAGAERANFEALARERRVTHRVKFAGPLPARQAFLMGRLLVVPSHAESFPYIILEAVAAQIPLVATAVGGIPEMLPRGFLVPPRDSGMLAKTMRDQLEAFDESRQTARQLAAQFRDRFDARKMCTAIISFYSQVMARSEAPG